MTDAQVVADINAKIYSNGARTITGSVLNAVLKSTIWDNVPNKTLAAITADTDAVAVSDTIHVAISKLSNQVTGSIYSIPITGTDATPVTGNVEFDYSAPRELYSNATTTSAHVIIDGADASVTLKGSQNTIPADVTTLKVKYSGITVTSNYSTFGGIKYAADYSANFSSRSLVDKAYADLALDRTNHTGTQDASTITGTKTSAFISDWSTAVDAVISAQKAIANGLATLGSDGKIPSSQLPSIAISDVYVVADEPAMLALSADVGDVAKRTDTGESYILQATPASTLSNWILLSAGGTGAVDSVNGQVGVVVLTTTDITEGTNLYWTTTRFDTRFGTKTTTDLAEGSNLYYTASRFNTAFAAKTTDDLTEGLTNLYYTDARVATKIASMQSANQILNTSAATNSIPYVSASNVLSATWLTHSASAILLTNDKYITSTDGQSMINLGNGQYIEITTDAAGYGEAWFYMEKPTSSWTLGSAGGTGVLSSDASLTEVNHDVKVLLSSHPTTGIVEIKSPIITFTKQTADRVYYLDATKNFTASSTTGTELNYLSGVTSAIQTQLNTKESSANKGVANGYASLDSSGYVPLSQLPSSIAGAVAYQGTWDADANTPVLSSGSGTKGYYYVVSTAGATNLGGITDWKVGDWAIYNGTAWEKVDNTDGVASVNGYVGAVIIDDSDILPAMAGNTGRMLTTDGTNAEWAVGTASTLYGYDASSNPTALEYSDLHITDTTLISFLTTSSNWGGALPVANAVTAGLSVTGEQGQVYYGYIGTIPYRFECRIDGVWSRVSLTDVAQISEGGTNNNSFTASQPLYYNSTTGKIESAGWTNQNLGSTNSPTFAGITVSGTTSVGVSISTTTGTGLSIGTTTGVPIAVNRVDTSTNTSVQVGTISRTTSGTAAISIAGYLSYQLENASGIGFEVARHEWKATGVSNGTESGDYIIYTRLSGTLAEAVHITSIGDLRLEKVGAGLYVKEGTDATMGVATLVSGTVTVNTTKVTANSRILLTIQSLGTVTSPKTIAITARTASTSFTITSEDVTDTSVVAWIIVEPS